MDKQSTQQVQKRNQPAVFTLFLEEIKFEFRSKYNMKKNDGNYSGNEDAADV